MTAVQQTPIPQDAIQALETISLIDSIEWIDWTALTLVGVFFILGLFKGFVWQVSRVLGLVGAWALAGRYGPEGGELLSRWFAPDRSPYELPLFLSYVVIFIAAIVLFSVITWLLQKLVKDTGMTFYDRLGGAVLGVGTGSLAVVAILAFFYMFFPETTPVVEAAHRSYTMRYSQRAIELLGDTAPEPLRRMFLLEHESEAKPETVDGAGEPKGDPRRDPRGSDGDPTRSGPPNSQASPKGTPKGSPDGK